MFNYKFGITHSVPEDTIVFDLGKGKFDHHQLIGKEYREETYVNKDGKLQQIPYAAFGLLWKEFGRELCYNESAWTKFDRDFVLPVDAADNGVRRSTLSAAVGAFNPVWDENVNSNDRFFETVELMTPVFEAELRRVNSAAKAEALVKADADKAVNGIMVMEEYRPWEDIILENYPDILFVVFPSNRNIGAWNIRTVPDMPGSFSGRKLFPTEWLGNPDASLGMTFCHVNNFLAEAKDFQSALNIANIAVNCA